MPLLTTTIGAYPKPESVKVPDWFDPGAMDSSVATTAYTTALERLGEEAETIFTEGTRQVIEDQVSCGIDIPTDGEVRRENYVHYHCRHLDGFDFEKLTHRVLRGGAYETDLPTIRGPIAARESFLPHDWKVAQSFTERPVKITLPGPMTIADTTADEHYGDARALGQDLAAALNAEVLALAEAGCRHIQIDEPLFARKPQAALDYGLEHIDRCWQNVPDHVTKTMHMCCGYPNHLDQEDYAKADPRAYFELAEAVDASRVDVVSIEDAHRHNDLSLLDCFRDTGVIFGVIAIARSRVESVAELRERLQAALKHLPPERLIAGPDCGLGHLGRDLAMQKLRVLSEAARDL
ncbi:cobalamin-independent methionine synthase II family protein [Pelagibius litoralis]|uniref:Cobalamin-independent methionine synthase II family protein n=1 Tax=Pelagibius litoralis TaxID=374515 RepID=A0A967EYL8_9PROT|nr:cobalamin-independent methionine synthase II family protein [Pelagibius litoralis]NIA69843.1 cobalamin-independent methionine synthase II family protein [Pelagibius litoralis]